MNFDQHRHSVENILQRSGRDFQRQGIEAMSTECLQFLIEHKNDPQFAARISERRELIPEVKTLLENRRHEEMKLAAASNDPYSRKTYCVGVATLVATIVGIFVTIVLELRKK